jgi:hypothetical protein
MNIAAPEASVQKKPTNLRIDVAAAIFRQTSYLELKHVRCRVEDGRCVLLGTVRSFYVKQLAQNLVVQHWGRKIPVENRLEVQARPEQSESEWACK